LNRRRRAPACAGWRDGRWRVILGLMMALGDPRDRRFGESLVGRLVMVDARAMRFETLRYARPG
jgi:adenylyltransferase/sulfurtransferase